ncbi:hypothetical protein PVL29_021054 [Vitis rotundifolia]|uniref:Leucine-rich repeat-containing N-terminal plant-type domain-containing protein n=1 Tax=Vitis rotundifolia TaxID=103349 RepID=A0AA38YYF4_VITRO|nr:hypothetical protein PVL29_021054 [Vitis rotundifolia]
MWKESLNQIKPTPCKRRILAKKPHHSQVLSYPRILQQQSFLIGQRASDDPSAYPKVAAWKSEGDDSDCCSWDVLECDKDTGRSSCLYGSINFSSAFFRLLSSFLTLRSLNDTFRLDLLHIVGPALWKWH